MDNINIAVYIFLLLIILAINMTNFNKVFSLVSLSLLYYFVISKKIGEEFSVENIVNVFRENYEKKKIKVI